ncbi:TA system antitoxin ParD family protein [Bartonella queenslandensis]|uniref:TA system antitoxin ParD family protein n=1 Tax=Bartonella queenslandensis TaxID=481138 RepID=UPI0002FDDEC1|nr:hypothetical protein [Bartonella queenslandensis]
MATNIKLSDELVSEAKRYAAVYSRSLPKQIEYWSRIGKIAEENPDLSFEFIQAILLGKQENKDGHVTPFEFG